MDYVMKQKMTLAQLAQYDGRLRRLYRTCSNSTRIKILVELDSVAVEMQRRRPWPR